MCLADAVRAKKATRTISCLLGTAGRSRDYYTSGALADHFIDARLIRVATLEAFLRRANNGDA